MTGWRKRAPLPLLIFGPVIVFAAAAYFYPTGGRYEFTADAYVQSARVSTSSNVSGRVQKLLVHDNQIVHWGRDWISLEPAGGLRWQ